MSIGLWTLLSIRLRILLSTGLRILLNTGDLSQHRCDDGTADSSSDELKQRVCNCRREILNVPDCIERQINGEPHQTPYESTNLEAVHDRRGITPCPTL